MEEAMYLFQNLNIHSHLTSRIIDDKLSAINQIAEKLIVIKNDNENDCDDVMKRRLEIEYNVIVGELKEDYGIVVRKI